MHASPPLCMQGINVRHRAKELSALIRDRERVDRERAKVRCVCHATPLRTPALTACREHCALQCIRSL